MTDEKKKGGPLLIILIVVGAVAVLGVVGIGVMAVLGIYGTRRYLEQAKAAEGRAGVGALARGMIQCAETKNALPPTSRAVPAVPLAGTKYQSTSTDWADPAFTCAHFEMSMPQYFQYQWVSKGPNAGTARAVADLAGDGHPITLELDVTCTPGATWSCEQSHVVRETH